MMIVMMITMKKLFHDPLFTHVTKIEQFFSLSSITKLSTNIQHVAGPSQENPEPLQEPILQVIDSLGGLVTDPF